MLNKKQWIVLVVATGLNQFSCKKEEPAANYFVGTWDLTEFSYDNFGNIETTNYAPGARVYEFMADSSLQVRIAGNAPLQNVWKISGKDEDSLVFMNMEPWKITNKSDNAFHAEFFPFVETQGVYKFSRQP